uniref:3-deoxy-7-phosphoheptulonate synthase n=1 Tax=Megaviridae environmental sample TaxID=1737588 RepID=A0A5J6VKX2_9VIRU|nr:MAG: DAHP synthetase I family protein [Megaviridae environmental sample]
MNTNISSFTNLPLPKDIKNIHVCSENIRSFVNKTRESINNILDKKSFKKLVIIGPCSIHDYDSAIEYAKYIKQQREKYKDTLEIVMRTYFSKPRTNIGWKGFVYDPYLDKTNNISAGINLARKLLLEILNLEVPCCMEHVDTIIPQYFDDLLSWGAIGARTSESQIHRELASGISTPIGFKNNTEGNIDSAIQSIKSSRTSHCFIGCLSDGNISMITTKGNFHCHVILRGGRHSPNYYRKNIHETIQKLKANSIVCNIMVDCSHGNSNKQYKNQLIVCKDVCEQMSNNKDIIGIMIESNLIEGNQDINNKPLKYGQSITDSCINLEDSDTLLDMISRTVFTPLKLSDEHF